MMIDSKKTVINLQQLAINYQISQKDIDLSKLNTALWNYLMKKTINGKTDNLSLFDRQWCATDTLTKILQRISTYDFNKLRITAIVTLTFKQTLIKYYNKYTLRYNKKFVSLNKY